MKEPWYLLRSVFEWLHCLSDFKTFQTTLNHFSTNLKSYFVNPFASCQQLRNQETQNGEALNEVKPLLHLSKNRKSKIVNRK